MAKVVKYLMSVTSVTALRATYHEAPNEGGENNRSSGGSGYSIPDKTSPDQIMPLDNAKIEFNQAAHLYELYVRDSTVERVAEDAPLFVGNKVDVEDGAEGRVIKVHIISIFFIYQRNCFSTQNFTNFDQVVNFIEF